VIHDRLKELGELYVLRTREELLLLNREVTAARQGNPESLLIMQRAAHRISGSGAMLGFKAISEAAAQIERIMRRADPVPTAEEWTIITALLQQIQSGLDQPATSTDIDG